MSYRIYDCSEKAAKRLKEAVEPVRGDAEGHGNAKYPIRELGFAQSFAVPFDEAQEGSLRHLAFYHSNRKGDGRRFTVIKHPEHSCFEFVRIK